MSYTYTNYKQLYFSILGDCIPAMSSFQSNTPPHNRLRGFNFHHRPWLFLLDVHQVLRRVLLKDHLIPFGFLQYILHGWAVQGLLRTISLMVGPLGSVINDRLSPAPLGNIYHRIRSLKGMSKLVSLTTSFSRRVHKHSVTLKHLRIISLLITLTLLLPLCFFDPSLSCPPSSQHSQCNLSSIIIGISVDSFVGGTPTSL